MTYPPERPDVPHFDPYLPAQPPKRRKRKGPRIFLGIVLGLAVLIAVAVAVSGGGPSAKYSARVQDQLVMNPADLAVTVRVANTGNAAGAPTCTVQASDPSGTYTGIDEGTLSSAIQPGSFAVYVDHLTITKEGAQYVTQVTVSCS